MTGFVAVNRDITERKRIEKELVEIRSRLVQSQEISRLALAQEIHDGPVQALYALLYRIAGVQAAAHDEREEVELGVLREELRIVIETLRAISVELRPPALAPYGLEKAIRSHVETIRHRHPPFTIHLELDSDGQLLPASTRLAMYRIYQEAIMNTLRHAQASNVEVHLALKPGEVELAIQDDGVGFQVPERMVDLVREGHLGLVGAYERAQAAGLSLELASNPGKGTQVRVTAVRPEQGVGG